MINKLSKTERAELKTILIGWTDVEGCDAIEKTFLFKDFKEAFSFMSKVAELADNVDHHPEWFNVYSRVEVTLTTHNVGGVTKKDVEMAKAMNELVKT